MTPEEAKALAVAKIVFPQGDNYYAQRTMTGKWKIGYTNDYPMQHGDGEHIVINDWFMQWCISNLKNNEGVNEIERLKGIIENNYCSWFRLFYRATSTMTARQISEYESEQWKEFKEKNNLSGVNQPKEDEQLDPAFDKWLEDNRWFTYSPVEKLWHYTFEQGTSISKQSYRKNYMKTTEQLYSLFKQHTNTNQP